MSVRGWGGVRKTSNKIIFNNFIFSSTEIIEKDRLPREKKINGVGGVRLRKIIHLLVSSLPRGSPNVITSA